MPPSGYSLKQATATMDFLRFCAEDLEREARSLGRTLVASLEAEIEQIDRLLEAQSSGEFADSMLLLTKRFYQAVARRSVSGVQEFQAAVEDVLDDVEREILEVHVPQAILTRSA